MSSTKRWRATGPALFTMCLGLALLTSCTAAEPTDPLADLSTETGELGLPLVPWEGGSEYWKQFEKADQAGWSDPSFFPIVAWYDSASDDSEILFDKKLGINTYVGMPDTLDSQLLDDHDMYWIGGALNKTFTSKTKSWVGHFLDDEVDGRFSPKEGKKHLAERKAEAPKGLFSYANFTYMVLENDLDASVSTSYINNFTDVVSVDKYWYTIPHCSAKPYRDVSVVPVAQEWCRSSSSYGKTMQALRQRDAADGEPQPLWQFVENMTGADQETNFGQYIDSDQLAGAVMASVINEARGIVYFNQSFAGPCKSSNVFRSAQVVPDFCGQKQVSSVQEVNGRIHSLAPVINTQSLEYSFGEGLSTMLKIHDGYAYLFAMTDGQSPAGERAFEWPEGISGTTAKVMFENRSVEFGANGRMTDDFASESNYHIYKVRI